MVVKRVMRRRWIGVLLPMALVGCRPSMNDVGIYHVGMVATGDRLDMMVRLYEPAGAIDVPVAAGNQIAEIGDVLRRHAIGVPAGIRTVVLHFSTVARVNPDAFRDWSTMTIPFDRLRRVKASKTDSLRALNLVDRIAFADPQAAGVARAFCADPANAGLAVRYCHLVAAG